MKPWDVLFIGSGISALTCAALLAQKGKSVCLLEQHTKAGGYLHCFNRFGIRFDTGTHYVGGMDPGHPFHTLLNYMGVYDEDLFVPLEPDGFDVFKFPSFEARFSKGFEATIASLSDQFPEEAKGIRDFFDLVALTAGQFPTYRFNETYPEMQVLKALETPLSQVVESFIKSSQLRSVLYAHCVNHGVEPEEISFGLHSLVTDSLIRSPYGFKKGGDALTQKYVERIEAQGGKVCLNTRVTRLVTEGNTIKEVITSTGETFHADWVVSSAHPKSTFRLVNADLLTPAFHRRLDGTKESIGIFGVYANCSRPSGLDPLRNYYFFQSDDPAHLLKVKGPFDPPSVVYVSCTRRLNDGNGPFPLTFHSPGPIAWFSEWKDTTYGKRPPAYREMKRKVGAHVIDFVDNYVPGIKDGIKQFDCSSPLTNLHYNGSEEGSAYGIYHSIQNTGIRAMGPRTHVRNLLLTGQNSLFPGLLGASISGLRTAGSLVGIKPLLKELRLRGEQP